MTSRRSARIFRSCRAGHGKPLVYLDNGASAQKPQAVIDAVSHAYANEYANVHRGLHFLSNAATDAYEGAREIVRRFLNAPSVDNVVFTKSTTEAINTVAYGYGMPHIGEGDEIVITIMEHHSNIVPWHFLRERQGAKIVWVGVDDHGNFDLDDFRKALTDRTKLVAITHMSNVLGTVVPSRKSAASPMSAASRCSSTAARPRCICRSTCRTSIATGT
jgi:cysteine desulfurase/selenocysteine lyase